MENQLQKSNDIKGLMSNEMVKSKFAEILGKNAPAFISSVTTLATNSKLIECEPKSVLSAAIAAASLNLQITPTLGFAAIIPYGRQAQFQIMAKGLIQLALRTGQFKTVNVTEIYEGEMQNVNRLTGEFDFTGEKKSDTVVGYAAYFSLLNGFEKALYMSTSQIKNHGMKFSKTYNHQNGAWKINFEAMARKTVLKLLLSRYAPLSVEMQAAVTQDQAAIEVDEELEIIDANYLDSTSTDATENEEPDKVHVEPEVKAKRKTQPKQEEIELDPGDAIDVPDELKDK